MVGARVSPETRAAIIALRIDLGGVEEASMAAVLRELLGLALAAINPGTARRVGALAVAWGCSREAAWARVTAAGLELLEREKV